MGVAGAPVTTLLLVRGETLESESVTTSEAVNSEAVNEQCPDWWPYTREFPSWHVWRGVAGLLYARRPRSSPPRVVRGKDADALRDQIRQAETSR